VIQAVFSRPFLCQLDGATALLAVLFIAAVVLVVMLRLQLGAAQRNARELQERVDFAARRRRAAMELFNTFGSAFETSISLENLMRAILAFFMRVTQASGGLAYLLDPKAKVLRLHARCGTLGATGVAPNSVAPGEIELGTGLLGEVGLSGRPIIINDAASDPRLAGLGRAGPPVQNAMVVPLRFREHNLGLMVVINHLTEDGQVGKPFGRFEFQLLEAMALYAATAIHLTLSYLEQSEKQRLDFDLGVAGEIQRTLLPRHSPDVPGFTIGGLSRPAHQVGGDCYDFIPLANDRLGVVIADVSGKGVNGALLMAICRTVIRNHAPRFETPVEAILEFRRHLLPDLPEDKFVTLTYGILDPAARRFTFARAGHDPLLSYRGATRTPSDHSPAGGAIGLDHSARFEHSLKQEALEVEPGDILLLFTDGITETLNPEGNEFGMDRLRQHVTEHSSLVAAELCTSVLAAVGTFARDEPAVDDQTLIAIKAS